MISLALQNGKMLFLHGEISLNFDADGNMVATSSSLKAGNPSSIPTPSLSGVDAHYKRLQEANKPPVAVLATHPYRSNNGQVYSNRIMEAAEEGEMIFAGFVAEWNRNFDIEDSPQPDRGALMQDVMNHNSLPIFSYIRVSGGLTAAVMKVSKGSPFSETENDFRSRCRILAENMAQVGSILCPPIVDFLEYPFRIEQPQETDHDG